MIPSVIKRVYYDGASRVFSSSFLPPRSEFPLKQKLIASSRGWIYYAECSSRSAQKVFGTPASDHSYAWTVPELGNSQGETWYRATGKGVRRRSAWRKVQAKKVMNVFGKARMEGFGQSRGESGLGSCKSTWRGKFGGVHLGAFLAGPPLDFAFCLLRLADLVQQSCSCGGPSPTLCSLNLQCARNRLAKLTRARS